MEDNIKDNIHFLEQLVQAVQDIARIVAASTDKESDLLEELRQIAAALHFTLQTLKHRLGIDTTQYTDNNSTIVASPQAQSIITTPMAVSDEIQSAVPANKCNSW